MSVTDTQTGTSPMLMSRSSIAQRDKMFALMDRLDVRQEHECVA